MGLKIFAATRGCLVGGLAGLTFMWIGIHDASANKVYCDEAEFRSNCILNQEPSVDNEFKTCSVEGIDRACKKPDPSNNGAEIFYVGLRCACKIDQAAADQHKNLEQQKKAEAEKQAKEKAQEASKQKRIDEIYGTSDSTGPSLDFFDKAPKKCAGTIDFVKSDCPESLQKLACYAPTPIRPCEPHQISYVCIPPRANPDGTYAISTQCPQGYQTEAPMIGRSSKDQGDEEFEGTGECKTNKGIGDNHCSSTRKWTKGLQLSNQIAEVTDAAIVGTHGQSQVANAMGSTDASASYKAAAESADFSGDVHRINGGLQVVAGAVLLNKSRTASNTAEEIGGSYKSIHVNDAKTGTAVGSGNGQKIVRNFKLNERTAGGTKDEREAHIRLKAAGIAGRAEGELNNASDEAQITGIIMAAKGAAKYYQGTQEKKMADSYREIADQMANAPTGPAVSIGGDVLPFDDGAGDGALPPPILTGSTDPTQGAASAEADKEKGLEGLGENVNPFGAPDNLGGPAPESGSFKADAGGSGGGGGGGVSAGSTSADSGGGGEGGGADYGEIARNAAGYDSGGGGGYAGGGGGGAGAGVGGPDLSGLLSQFLPQKEDAEKAKNGILAFGEQGRNPANENFSLLDKNANIFQRISETYQDKHKRGNIGL